MRSSRRIHAVLGIAALVLLALPGALRADEPTEALRRAIITRVQAGERSTVKVNYGGMVLSARLIGADERGIRVIVYGNAVRIAWSDLKPERLYGVGRKVLNPSSASDRALLEGFRKASGLPKPGQAKPRRVSRRRRAGTRRRASSSNAPTRPVGIVANIKVVSDKVEDVSSIDTWKKAFIRPNMSDKEKALAVWETVVKFRQQDSPPNEFLQASSNVHDPIKTFNVYGYGMCCCASSNIEALSRAVGLKARGLGIHGHSVPEVFWKGDWHLLDASLICYFPDAGGEIASVKEIVQSITSWYQANPGFKGNDGKLRRFMRGGGWKNGPAVLAKSRYYDRNGWLPAATHGWYSTMAEYDGSRNFIYEYGYSQGYRVNVRLREGESITRNWFNKGLHVNMDGKGGTPGSLRRKVGAGDLRYAPKYGDIAPGRVGNGTRFWDVPLANVKLAAQRFENLATKTGKSPAVHVKAAGQPGILELRMPSSYIYLGGKLTSTFVVGNGGSVRVSLSRNNGQDWKEILRKTDAGKSEQTIDLKPHIYRLYDYSLRFEIAGAGTGLNALRIEQDIQHSQRALPALAAGSNTITFSADPPAENTITIEGCTKNSSKGNQLNVREFGPVYQGTQSGGYGIGMTAGKGTVTFPVETPGDMTRIRFGGHYRARAATDGWDLQVSTDDGKTWTTVDRLAGPTPGSSKYAAFDKLPKGTRKALVRYSGSQRNTTVLFDLRIDADYVEPNGGFRPVKITYLWEENGQTRRHVHVARKPNESYKITCGSKPLMKSLIVELAQ